MRANKSNQVVDSSYLRNVTVKCILIFIAGLFGTAGIYYLMLKEPIGPTYGAGFKMLAQLDQDIMYKSLIIYGSTVLVALVCIIILTMLYSHRVAGPIYRLRLFTRQLREGDLSVPVTLRESDVIHPLCTDMNHMVESFHSSVSNINSQIEELDKIIAGSAKGDKTAAEDGKRIGRCADEICSIISHYKL